MQIKTSDGFTQIDDNYENYTLVSQGTATTASAFNSYVDIPHPWTSTKPLVFVKNTGSYQVNYIGSSDTTTPLTVANNFYTTSSNTVRISTGQYISGSFEYRIYTKTFATNPTSGYGMKVMDSNGNCVFNSNQTNILRVIKTLKFSSLPETSQTLYTNNSNSWISIFSTDIATWYDGGSQVHDYGIQFNANTVILSRLFINNLYGSTGGRPRYDAPLIYLEAEN